MMALTSKSRLPRWVKERIICEYLSGSKRVQTLSEEYDMSKYAINQLVSRHRSKPSPTFEANPILVAMNRKKTTEEAIEKLLQENQELRHCIEQAQLKIESDEIMGDIWQES